MGKKVDSIFKVIGALTVLVVFVVLVFLAIDLLVIQKGILFEEAYRITSPDGKVDVVGMHYDAGATTSRIEMVYIVPANRVLSKIDRKMDRCVPVFMAEHI